MSGTQGIGGGNNGAGNVGEGLSDALKQALRPTPARAPGNVGDRDGGATTRTTPDRPGFNDVRPGRSGDAPGQNKQVVNKGDDGNGGGNRGPQGNQGDDGNNGRRGATKTVGPKFDNTQAQQIRHRLATTQLPPPAAQRTTQTTQTNAPLDVPQTRNDQGPDARPPTGDSTTPVNLKSRTGGDDRNVFDRRDGDQPKHLGRDLREAARTLFDPPANGRDRDKSFNPNHANGRERNGPPDSPHRGGRGNFSPPLNAGSPGRGAGDLPNAASGYLRGAGDGPDLSPEARALLRSVANELGPDFVNRLGDKSADKVFKLVERALEHYARAAERGGQFERAPHNAAHGLERHHGGNAPGPHAAREVLADVLGAAQLDRYLRHLEKTGGHVVGQAAAAVARTLYGEAAGGAAADRPAPAPFGGADSRPHPQEVLRDLRAGTFVPPQEQFNAFPLTGRARVVAEMMELMRTLDAMQAAVSRAAAHSTAAQRSNAEGAFVAWLKGLMSADGAGDELLSQLLPPTLPGRAARNEIPRFVAALGGMLTDADGRALLARDGTPLRLERLVWLSTAGGLVDGSLLGPSFKGDNAPTRLSPLLLYGFDAIYTVIGFDGRTLAAPHFVAVQAAANDAEHEWAFGQQPFTAGWVREAIERLKDSALVEHNLLGETLEEALCDGRFHVALLGVPVEEGRAADDSASVKGLLPGASGDLAFA